MTYTKEQIIHAEELRNERIELRKEHDSLLGERHIVEGGWSRKLSLTRKINKVHARILELNATLRDASPSPLEPEGAIREIGIIVKDVKDDYDKERYRFIEHVGDDPEYVIRNCLENMMIAKAKVHFFRPISKILQSDPTLDVLKKSVNDTLMSIMNDHILKIDSPSTSRESNLLDEYKHEAAVKLLQKRMASTNVFDQIDNIFAGVEMWRILQK